MKKILLLSADLPLAKVIGYLLREFELRTPPVSDGHIISVLRREDIGLVVIAGGNADWVGRIGPFIQNNAQRMPVFVVTRTPWDFDEVFADFPTAKFFDAGHSPNFPTWYRLTQLFEEVQKLIPTVGDSA